MIKKRPPRLYRVFADAPLYFVTFSTRDRRPLVSLSAAHGAFVTYAQRAYDDFNTAVGRYVIMPDHVHLFVCGGGEFELSKWVGGLKRAVSVGLGAKGAASLWQPGFFDHVLRSDESYSEKWQYVHQNPVRAGLVCTADEWPYSGEIVSIDRA
jgi:putative transposase